MKQAVGKGQVVVREQRFHDKRRLLPEIVQKTQGRFARLLSVAFQVDPTAGSVDGHKQVGAVVLIAHLRQVLDVDVEVAGYVVLKALLGRGLALGRRDKVLALRDAMTDQQPLQRRVPDLCSQLRRGPGLLVDRGTAQHRPPRSSAPGLLSQLPQHEASLEQSITPDGYMITQVATSCCTAARSAVTDSYL